MVLKFKFKYISNNNNFIHILNNILSNKETEYKIDRENDFIFLYIEDEEERLLKISDEISSELPISLFLEDFTLEVVPQIPDTKHYYTSLSQKKSYCSSCLKIVEKEGSAYYNPFIDCGVCGTTCDAESLQIKKDGKDFKYNSFKELFELISKELLNDNKVKINGKVFSKFKGISEENQDILCVNLENLSSLVVGSKQKLVILLSLEKPIINFNVNRIYQLNHDCNIQKVNIRASWNLFLQLLSIELKKLGINFLSIDEDKNFDMEIEFEDDFNPCKISITENKIFLLENQDYDEKLDSVYSKTNEKSISQFLVLISENNLYKKSILNFFISSKYNDTISLYSPKIDGLIDVLKFEIPKTFNDIFQKIIENENGKKLIENYKKKYPNEFSNALNYDISNLKTASIMEIFKLVSLILGIDDIFKKASETLIQRGPRIDYKLKQSDKIFNKEFDLAKFIGSGMSFKLAGVDEKVISLGYVENFAYFISELIDDVNENFIIDGVSFCGDLIANEFFYKLVNKAISKNYKLYYNKDFPIQL